MWCTVGQEPTQRVGGLSTEYKGNVVSKGSGNGNVANRGNVIKSP